MHYFVEIVCVCMGEFMYVYIYVCVCVCGRKREERELMIVTGRRKCARFCNISVPVRSSYVMRRPLLVSSV